MSTFRLVIAIILGVVAGSIVNMAIVLAGHHMLGAPAAAEAAADLAAAAGIAVAPAPTPAWHLAFPFLAHALGTLEGAFIALVIASRHKLFAALAVGVVFLVGGIIAARMIAAPVWFIALDLVLAYLPMAWLGHWLAIGRPAKRVTQAG